jgi:CRISPR-associated protein Cas2
MGTGKSWYLVAYDIREPARLAKTAKHLKGYGVRLQYSLFRCRLTERQVELLRWELSRILAKEDDLLIIGLCAACSERVARKNESQQWVHDVLSYEVV